MHPTYEKNIKSYLADRRSEMEVTWLPKTTKSNSPTSLKLAIVMSGIVLVGIVIIQMFVI